MESEQPFSRLNPDPIEYLDSQPPGSDQWGPEKAQQASHFRPTMLSNKALQPTGSRPRFSGYKVALEHKL